MSGETGTQSGEEHGARRRRGPWLEGWRLDAVVTALSALLIAGVALDFRRHAEGISFAEEGFFTPEHVFFYSMFLGIAAVIGAATYRNRRTGRDWVEAVPPGYGWGVVGVLLFGVGGVADFGWHSAFGFEEGVEGITSPSHLALATGAALYLASPLRAAWRRDGEPTGVALAPALVSASLVLSVLALFTWYVNPVMRPLASRAGEEAATAGVPGFVVFPALLVGAALALARRFDLPAGSLALVFGVPALASATPNGRFELVVPVVVAGLVGDALVRWRPPTPANPRALRLFGVLVPATFASGYFAVVGATRGIGWTVHVWAGAVVLAGFAGLLLTYVVLGDAAGAGGT